MFHFQPTWEEEDECEDDLVDIFDPEFVEATAKDLQKYLSVLQKTAKSRMSSVRSGEENFVKEYFSVMRRASLLSLFLSEYLFDVVPVDKESGSWCSQAKKSARNAAKKSFIMTSDRYNNIQKPDGKFHVRVFFFYFFFNCVLIFFFELLSGCKKGRSNTRPLHTIYSTWSGAAFLYRMG